MRPTLARLFRAPQPSASSPGDGPSGDGDRIVPPPLWVAALESTLIVAGTILVGYWADPRDPFLIGGDFSWTALAPLLAGLRYGFAYGFGSALLMIIGLAGGWRLGWLPIDGFPSRYSVGLMVVGMIAGEFSDVWNRSIRRQGVISEYRRLRLAEFARAYHLLKVSHDTLEQRMAGSTQNLREALLAIRRQLGGTRAVKDANKPLLGLERMILEVFANYGWIQIAALYPVGLGGQPSDKSLAHIGQKVDLPPNDPLMAQALASRRLMSVRPELSPEQRGTALLVAIPIVDVRERVWGVVVVREMLFIAFQEENLKLLAVLGGHIGDILTYGTGLPATGQGSRREFLRQMERCIEDARRYDLPAGLVIFAFPGGDKSQNLVQAILGQRRGLDQAIVLESRDSEPRIFVLMPITDRLGTERYLARLGPMVRERLGGSLDDLGIERQIRTLGKKDDAEAVYLEICEGFNIAPPTGTETEAA